MTRLTLRTPSRLHFGLLSWGRDTPRQFGGVGLMIEAPGLLITAESSATWKADGPMSARLLDFAAKVAEGLTNLGQSVEPAAFQVIKAPPEHVGLGLGTQLGLGVARLLCERVGVNDPSVTALAELSGRGLRSGIGLHGFLSGGLVVDGGRGGPEGIPPLLARLDFPSEWSILIVMVPRGQGLHGPSEVQAFADLPPSPELLTDRLCRVVLLGLLPSVVERDLIQFGESLEEIQERVGQGFATAQGGTFARPELEAIAAAMRASGLRGVGQSSWGPTLYGFSDGSPEERSALLTRLLARVPLDPGTAFWTTASPRGHLIHRSDGSSPEPA